MGVRPQENKAHLFPVMGDMCISSQKGLYARDISEVSHTSVSPRKDRRVLDFRDGRHASKLTE